MSLCVFDATMQVHKRRSTIEKSYFYTRHADRKRERTIVLESNGHVFCVWVCSRRSLEIHHLSLSLSLAVIKIIVHNFRYPLATINSITNENRRKIMNILLLLVLLNRVEVPTVVIGKENGLLLHQMILF